MLPAEFRVRLLVGVRGVAQLSEFDSGEWTAADLVRRFGAIPLHRVQCDPLPGLASEDDVAKLCERKRCLCELAEGVLLEKAMGAYEAYLAALLSHFLTSFVRSHDLGIVFGADAMMRLAPGLVRIPDVSFVSWGRLPSRRISRAAFFSGSPDLAVEVISKGNTPEEMSGKLEEYFAAGTRLVWYVYHMPQKEVRVFTSPQSMTIVPENGTLDGGDVLPGFQLDLSQLFAEPEESAAH
jgi:Uma2 family endonuclease